MNLKCPQCSHEFELQAGDELDVASDCPQCGSSVPIGPQSSIDIDFSFDLDGAFSDSGLRDEAPPAAAAALTTAAEWRRMIMSALSAQMFLAVSFKVSPFTKLLASAFMETTSALRRVAAISKARRVRVLGSRKRLTMVFPLRTGTFLTVRSNILLNAEDT